MPKYVIDFIMNSLPFATVVVADTEEEAVEQAMLAAQVGGHVQGVVNVQEDKS